MPLWLALPRSRDLLSGGEGLARFARWWVCFAVRLAYGGMGEVYPTIRLLPFRALSLEGAYT